MPSKIYDLIIIGAGISGLSAAYEAKKQGLSTLVLEGRDRLGGRIYSKKLANGLVIELGGEWLGSTHKEILNFCRKAKIKLEPHRYTSPRYFLADGREYNELDQIFEKFEKLLSKTNAKKISSKLDWYSFLQKTFNEEELKVLGTIYGADFASHMRYVAAKDAYAETITGGKNDHMDFHVQGGNTKIIDQLAKNFGKTKILLNQKVLSINDQKQIVEIKTVTNNFFAKKILLTATANSFKQIEIYPPMKEKKDCARELKYGDITKAFFSFSTALPLEKQNFSMFTETDLEFVFVATQGQSAKKFALCVYAVGLSAKKNARMKPENLWKKLKKLLPKDTFPTEKMHPDQIIVQHWGTDPFTHGGYCIFNPQERQKVLDNFSKPHGNIHFAGDYLGKIFNYINGAFQSGQSEAKKIGKLQR